MTDRLQLLSIKVINSNYKFLFYIFIYLLIYSCYYTNIAYNMGNFFSIPKETIPEIAEHKGVDFGPQLKKQIEALENRNSFLGKNLLSRSDEIIQLKEINSRYLARLQKIEHDRDLAVSEAKQLVKRYEEFKVLHEKEKQSANEMIQSYKRRYIAYKECFDAMEDENQELRKKLKRSEEK